jgi:hypothetical protein
MSRTGAGKVIFGLLSATSDVTDIVGTSPVKVFPIVAPQGIKPPYVTYFKVSSDPQNSKDGQPVDHIRMQIDCYALTYPQLEDLHAAVDAALNLYSGTINGVLVDEIRFETENDTVEEEEDFYRLSADYLLRIKL